MRLEMVTYIASPAGALSGIWTWNVFVSMRHPPMMDSITWKFSPLSYESEYWQADQKKNARDEEQGRSVCAPLALVPFVRPFDPWPHRSRPLLLSSLPGIVSQLRPEEIKRHSHPPPWTADPPISTLMVCPADHCSLGPSDSVYLYPLQGYGSPFDTRGAVIE